MRKIRFEDDEGVAIVMAMGTMVVVMALILTMIAYISQTNRSAGRDRQRAADIAAAEAGVDAGYLALQSSGATLPCTTLTGGVSGAPDNASYSATITYVYADGTESAACPAAMTAHGAPTNARIKSVGSVAYQVLGSSSTTRVFEALVKLRPIQGNGFNKAIFSNSALTFANKTTVNGDVGSDGDVYTNGDFACQNNSVFHGSVYIQGNGSFANTCAYDGDVYARGNLTMDSKLTAGGRLLSSNGNITWKVNQNPTVGGVIQAGGTISTAPPCTTNAGKCFAGASIPPPPYLSFPIVRSTAPYIDEWTDPAKGGFTQIAGPADCSLTTVKNWITSVPQTLTTKSLVITSCFIHLKNHTIMTLKNDLAIFSTAGFWAEGQLDIGSTANGVNHKIYWIVPYNAAASMPCTTPGIDFRNFVDITADIDMMAYSPCTIDIANHSNHFGQIYGGSDVQVMNQMNMTYSPLPMFGVDTSNLPTLGYNVDVLYKRETTR